MEWELVLFFCGDCSLFPMHTAVMTMAIRPKNNNWNKNNSSITRRKNTKIPIATIMQQTRTMITTVQTIIVLIGEKLQK